MYDPTALRSYVEHHFTYIAGFERNVHRYRARTAMIDPRSGRHWTYGELGADVEALASALLAQGVTRGSRVLCQLFNVPEFAILYLATQRIGAIDVPINFRLSPGETAFILADSEPEVYLFDARIAETAGAALKRWGGRTIPVQVGQGDDAGARRTRVPGARGYDEFVATGDVAALPPLPEDFSTFEETTRLYTSGTTGMPKGVPLPSFVEVMSAHDVMMHFPLGPTDRTLNMTPWFHRGGLYSGGPNPVFYAGGSVVPMPVFDPGTALDWVDEYGITFLIGAPATLASIADEQEARPRPLEGLRGIVTMGAPLDRDAALRYQQLLTPRIFNGYGTSEGFWNTFLRPEDLPEHAGSAGRASTDDDVAVVKIFDDRRAEPDELVARDGQEVGEIIMRTPKSGFAYANLPDVQEEKFFRGWMYPGDIGTWDADGFVTVLGRIDDMIISGGENVHPVQVEEALVHHPGVADAAVVGIPNPQWGQLVVAYVVRKDPPVSAADLDEMLRADEDLADFKRPRGYRFVDSIPMTATGKKMHFKVAQTAAEDAGNDRIEMLAFGRR